MTMRGKMVCTTCAAIYPISEEAAYNHYKAWEKDGDGRHKSFVVTVKQVEESH